MNSKRLFPLTIGIALLALSGCGTNSSNPPASSDPAEPAFQVSRFGPSSATVAHPFLPLVPGTSHTYQVATEDGVETIVAEVLQTPQAVAGVECVVVHDRVYLDTVLEGDTYNWYAQDDNGNVWYLGEEVTNYEYDDAENLLGTNDDGSWEAGVDGALPGIQMWAAPLVGSSYYQEYWEDEATDMGLVIATGVEVKLEDGTTYTDCLQTLDWNPLDSATLEYKYYAPGVGLVKEAVVGGDEVVELLPPE